MTNRKLASLALALSIFTLGYASMASADVTANTCGDLLTAAQNSRGSTATFMNFLRGKKILIKQCSAQCGQFDFTDETNAGPLHTIATAQGNMAAAASCQRKFGELAYFASYGSGLNYAADNNATDFNSAKYDNFIQDNTDPSNSHNNVGSSADNGGNYDTGNTTNSTGAPKFTPTKPASGASNNHIDFW
ncbi:MAG: hypothetical protein K0U12_00905 [Gammaproteobacteria bacterium]|nr:hypothetical protein [Gammaproteobacteria bacterium]